jgi:hypothetical protein
MVMLPDIPLIDIGSGGAPALAAACPERFADLRGAAVRRFTAVGLILCDMVARSWLRRSNNPFFGEISQLATSWRAAGAFALNASCDFSSATGAVANAQGNFRLVRVLDWDLDGLGRNLVLTRQRGSAGQFYALTWPGMVGVFTGLAKGRFAAAFNQSPRSLHRLGRYGDWLVNQSDLWRQGGLPADHLLRQVFETAPDYATAQRMLRETPLATSAFFTLVGPNPGEGCIIERTRTESALRPGPAAVANHWCLLPLRGRSNGKQSVGRQSAMERLLNFPPVGLNWLAPPVLNKETRMVVVTDPASGTLVTQGWDRGEPSTQPLILTL